jgi:hypothetical protein
MRLGRPLAGCTHRLRYAQDEKDVEHESGSTGSGLRLATR